MNCFFLYKVIMHMANAWTQVHQNNNSRYTKLIPAQEKNNCFAWKKIMVILINLTYIKIIPDIDDSNYRKREKKFRSKCKLNGLFWPGRASVLFKVFFWLFQVGHVVKNKWSELSLASHERFSCEDRKRRFTNWIEIHNVANFRQIDFGGSFFSRA